MMFRIYSRPIRFCSALLVAIAVNALSASQTLAQEEVGESEAFVAAAVDPVNNYYFWLRHAEGRQLGDVSPSTSVGGTRYVYVDNGVVMLNAQGLVTHNGDGGGNFGITRRFFVGDAIIGGSLSYDLNQSRNHSTFQQTAFSFELFTPADLLFRVNGYVPIGQRQQNVATFAAMGMGGLRFQGNNIVTGQNIVGINEESMRGIDFEVARGLGTLSAEVYTGYFNYQAALSGQTHGVKGGIRGYFTDSLAGDLTVSNDRLFGTNVFGGLRWFFGGRGGNAPTDTIDRLTIPVERNQQVVVNQVQTNVDREIALTNPRTNAPITVTHVNSSGAAGAGTFEDPNGSLTAAAGSASDIVYLHADSTFNGQLYTLADFQRVLGEADGFTHTVDTVELGTIGLLRATAGVAVPIVMGSTGSAFTLSPLGNNEISVVTIDSPSIHGIAALTGSSNINLNRLTIQNTVGDGIRITPSSNILIDQVNFMNIGGTAVFLNANNVAVTNSTINTTGLHGIAYGVGGDISGNALVQNVVINNFGNGNGIIFNNAQNGSQILVDNVAVNGGAGTGLSITDSQAGSSYTLNNLDIGAAGIGGNGVDIINSSGSVAFDSNSSINNVQGTVVNVDGGSMNVDYSGAAIMQINNSPTVNVNNHAMGTINFASNITATNGTGLQFNAATGTYNFTGANTLNGGDAGIDILGNSDGTFTFANTSITDPTGTALNVDNSNATINYNGGTISQSNNATTININSHTAGTINLVADINATNGTGLQFNAATGTYNFTGANTLNGGDAGIDILGGSDGTFTFADTSITNPSGTALNIDNSSADVEITAGTITQNNDATAVNVNNHASGTVNINTAINTTNGNGLQFNNADGAYTFGGPINMNGGDAGIDIINGSDGTFSFANTSINNAANGVGVNIDGGNAQATFNGLDVTTTNAAGINVNNTGSATITGTANVDSTGARAVNVDNALVNMTFNNVMSTMSSAEGININNAAAGSNFAVNGLAQIQTPGASGINIANSQGSFTFANVDIDFPTGDGITLSNNNTDGININGGQIDGTSTDGINSTNSNNVSINGVAIGGNDIIGDDGIEIVNSDATARNVSIQNTTIGQGTAVGNRGIFINSSGSGTLAATIGSNTITSDNQAILTNDGGSAGSLVLDLSNNGPLQTNIGPNPTIQIVGSGTNSTIIRSFTGTTIIGQGSAAGGGILFDRVTFDGSGPSLTGTQVVHTGTLQIGQGAGILQRVDGDGLSFINPTGNLSLADLRIFNTGGTGLEVDTKGLGTTFNLNVAAGSIDTDGGPVLFLDPLTGDINLTTVTSTFSPTNGVFIDEMAGSGTGGNAVTIGAVNVSNSTGHGLVIQNSSGNFTINTANISDITSGANAHGVSLSSVAGTVSIGGGLLSNIAGNGITAVDVDNLVIDSLMFDNIGSFDPMSESGTGDGLTFMSTGTTSKTLTFTNNQLTNVNDRGVLISAQSTGTMTANISGNSIMAENAAIQTRDGGSANALRIAIDGNTLSPRGIGIDMDAGAIGSTVVTSLNSNTVTDGAVGMFFNQITFDNALGGTTALGSTTDRLGLRGILMTNTAGTLSFDSLNIFNGFAEGLEVDGSGAPNMFTLNIADGNIDTASDPALVLNSMAAAISLASVTTDDGTRNGIELDGVSGNIAIGTATISNTNQNGIRIIDGATPLTATFLNTTITNSGTDDVAVDFVGAATQTLNGAGMFIINTDNGSTLTFDLQ